MIVRGDQRVIVQGITGRQGTFWTERMREYGTRIVAGVNPKKAGTEHCGGMRKTEERIAGLRSLLLQLLRRFVGRVVVNGSLEHRVPGNLSVSFPGVDAEAMVVRLKHVAAFSTGAACSSTKVEPSHVLIALSRDDDRAYSSVRFGVGRGNTEEEIRRVAEAVGREVALLRRMARGRA